MRTFRSWLIANLEIVYYVGLVLIILGGILFGHFTADEWFVVGIISIILLIVSILSIKAGLGVFLIILVVGGCGLLAGSAWTWLPAFVVEHKIYLIASACVAFVIGILIAIDAYVNFDDVVSMRFLYRNSDVSVFEEAWKYAFNRQFAGFMLVFGLALELLVVFNANELQSVILSEPSPETQERIVEEKAFPSSISLDGALSNGTAEYPIEMSLNLTDVDQEETSVKGFYRYKSQDKNKRIFLKGTCHPKAGTLQLFSDGGTERFDLQFDKNTGAMKGTWSQFKSPEDMEIGYGAKKLNVSAQQK